MLTPRKIRASPSSPCSRVKAHRAWLRVAPVLPSAALRVADILAASGRRAPNRNSTMPPAGRTEGRKKGWRHGALPPDRSGREAGAARRSQHKTGTVRAPSPTDVQPRWLSIFWLHGGCSFCLGFLGPSPWGCPRIFWFRQHFQGFRGLAEGMRFELTIRVDPV